MFGNTRVMVVEDGEIERVTLAQLLRFWGYETEMARDGLEALEKIQSFRPGVVISDLQMPRMGGIELLGALRKNHPDVDCIIVTGHGTLEKADAFIALGAVDYLDKPVDPERLRIDLRKCAQQARVTSIQLPLSARSRSRVHLETDPGALTRGKGAHLHMRARRSSNRSWTHVGP